LEGCTRDYALIDRPRGIFEKSAYEQQFFYTVFDPDDEIFFA